MEAWALPAHYKVWKKIQPKLFLISRLTLPPDWPSLCLENLGNVGVIKITVVNTFVSIFLTHMDDKFHYFDRNSDKISIKFASYSIFCIKFLLFATCHDSVCIDRLKEPSLESVIQDPPL